MILKVGVGVALAILWNGLAFAEVDPRVKQVVKLEPKIRIEKARPNSTISIDDIRPFLRSSLVLDCKEEFAQSPYIIAENENRLQGGPGTLIYAKGIKDPEETEYTIFRGIKEYKHPITGESLGFVANAVGSAELTVLGEPSELKVETATEGIEIGNRLLPSFIAQLPDTLTVRPVRHLSEEGYILSAYSGETEIGRNQVVLISLGQRNGVEEGNLLDIYHTGRKVRDPYNKGWRKQLIQLPDTKVGRLLIFQSYDKMSLGLVLEATEIIQLLDKVKCP